MTANALLQDKLKGQVRGELLFDSASRGRYATDASIYQVEPLGVLVPADEEDVRVAIQICAEHGIPVLPRGAGTSQCGQTVGTALVIDNSKYLNRIGTPDAAAMTVDVQPGVVLDTLNASLKSSGLWFPVDVSTSAQCTIGGMAGNNSCGSRSIVYGNMVHNVEAISAFLADGSRLDFGRLALPGSTGANGAHDANGANGAAAAAGAPRLAALAERIRAVATREQDEIERLWPTVLRRVGGYNLDIFAPRSVRPYCADGGVNLAHLLVGSEGTLAYSRRLTLKLSRLPQHRVLGVANFRNFYQAMDSAQHIVKLGPSAVELVDRTMIELSRANPALGPTLETALLGDPEAVLLVEFAGEDHAAQLRKLAQLHELLGTLGNPECVVDLVAPAAQKALWEVRKAGLNIMMSMRGDGKPVSFIEDCAVPLEHLADYTERLTEVFARHGTRGTWYAHASVGTLHVRPILDMRRGDATKMRAIANEAAALVRQFKGAYSGEHGDGLSRGEWVAWQFGPRLAGAFKEIKAAFDPQGIFNPGKIVDPPKMDDAALFRYKPGYRVIPLQTALDWSAWNIQIDPVNGIATPPGSGDDPAGGFAKAVDMCNNNGHCRKFDADTMCPSFRATGNERDLTRGRANSLRLALSGQLAADGGGKLDEVGETDRSDGAEDVAANPLASDALYATMDLCVGCKGCRRECPTGVDMAKMKIEFLAQYHRTRPRRLRERLIAQLPRLAPFAARWPALFNARDGVPGLAALTEKWWGLSARRRLPRWRRDTFLSGPAARAAAAPAESAAPRVVLLVDTFNNYFEPENARAAQAVLQALGYRVEIARPAADDDEPRRPLCCGRTYLASGMVEAARREASRTLSALAPYVAEGLPIIGLEPSCLLTLRDEALTMRLGRGAQALAEQALLFEEFLAQPDVLARLKPLLKPLGTEEIVLHGHCHQKAFDAVKPVQRVLGEIPGARVTLVESSCCGMAGSFGYDAAHYEVSMRMGEAALLPAMRRAHAAGAALVADGFSCRHQIADGAAAPARHSARILLDSLNA